MEFVAFSIGHAGITLGKIIDRRTAAFSTVRSHVEQARASRGDIDPGTDHNIRIHDYNIFKSMMDLLTDLAHSRLV